MPACAVPLSGVATASTATDTAATQTDTAGSSTGSVLAPIIIVVAVAVVAIAAVVGAVLYLRKHGGLKLAAKGKSVNVIKKGKKTSDQTPHFVFQNAEKQHEDKEDK